MRRTLRSGNSFGMWDGEAIDVVDTQFDLAQYVKRGIDDERDELSDEDCDYDYIEADVLSDAFIDARKPPTAAANAPAAFGENPTTHTPDSAFSAYQRPKRRTREHRKRKRLEAKPAAEEEEGVATRESTRRKYIDTALPIETNLPLSGLRVTRTGYTSMRDAPDQHRAYRVDELVGPKSKFQFDYFAWAGRQPVPFLSKQKVFGLLAGCPDKAPDWDTVMIDFANTIHAARPDLALRSNQKYHRRGPFPATAHGHSYGGGQRQPMSISENPANAGPFKRVLEHPGMTRISGFQNGVVKTWAPDYHSFLRENRRSMRSQHPDLRYNFRNSVWSATTINYGPRTATLPHKDFSNLPWGWCPITALGNYDPKRGGHLVLWELRLVVEFPPGSTIIIPSSLITHSNTTVGPGETRFSVTQYTAGALVRWVDQGFQTKEAFLASLTPEGRAAEEVKAKSRYLRGLGMYSTLDDLRTRHENGGEDSDSDLTELEDESEVGSDR
ncbi:hypothetical protein GGF50DRAFT_121366 [Schizophyllum commune]